MTAGLLAGLTRAGAARFSFLLSIPITALAGGYEILKIAKTGAPADLDQALLAAVVAGISGYLAIAFLLRLLQNRGMTPFVVYRLLLGAYLIAVFY
jgi:undecaprenyl-diphosphatase